MQYSRDAPADGTTNPGSAASGLPGLYKFGGWFDSARFPDQRYDNTGLPLASPASTGMAHMRRHNFSLYAAMDQIATRQSDIFALTQP